MTLKFRFFLDFCISWLWLDFNLNLLCVSAILYFQRFLYRYSSTTNPRNFIKFHILLDPEIKKSMLGLGVYRPTHVDARSYFSQSIFREQMDALSTLVADDLITIKKKCCVPSNVPMHLIFQFYTPAFVLSFYQIF